MKKINSATHGYSILNEGGLQIRHKPFHLPNGRIMNEITIITEGKVVKTVQIESQDNYSRIRDKLENIQDQLEKIKEVK
jgi:hypothetical protein